jgi:hypothetical protein
MSNELNPKMDPDEPTTYQIRLEGHLECEWTNWFDGLAITLEEDGSTLFTGPLLDQAALHGLLKKVRDLGIPLISVNRVGPGPSTTLRTSQADAPEVNKTIRTYPLDQGQD